MANPDQYDDIPLIRLYMDRITPNCLEDRVDHLWTQILRHYFHIRDNFGMEREVYTTEAELGRIDLIVTSVHEEEIYKTLFLEVKRSPKPARNITPKTWNDAALSSKTISANGQVATERFQFSA